MTPICPKATLDDVQWGALRRYKSRQSIWKNSELQLLLQRTRYQMHLFKDNLTGTPALSVIVKDRLQRRLDHKQMLMVLDYFLALFHQTSTWNHYLFSRPMCIREVQRNTKSEGPDKLIKPHRPWENWAMYIKSCCQMRNSTPAASKLQTDRTETDRAQPQVQIPLRCLG